jgi:hypothetical protein
MVSRSSWVLFAAVVCAGACSREVAQQPGQAAQALGDTTVTTDLAEYTFGAPVIVSYSGMSGDVYDWISIAPAGSPDTNYTQYIFTGGQLSGNHSFTGLGPGTWVARAYFANTYVKQAESAPFIVDPPTSTPTVTTDASSYQSGSTVTVTYTNMAGLAQDWIAIAHAGAPDTQYVQYVFTGGQVNGTAQFSGLANGTYVARAYFNNTFNKEAESAPFSIGVAISTDKTTYNAGEAVIVSYAGMQGNSLDWISIANDPSADTSWLRYQFTGGQLSGTATFTGLAPGSYFARAYFNNTYNKEAEIAFTITPPATPPSVTTDAATYVTGTDVIVTYAGMSGDPQDWIAVAPAGSPDNVYTKYIYTGGTLGGNASFSGLGVGTWVARAYFSNSFIKRAESASFTVTAPAGPATVSTDKSSYATGEDVVVTFSGMSGSSIDWISIAAAGSADSSFVQYRFTGGAFSGTMTFSGLAAGSYVARAYFNNTYTKEAETPTFTVGP